MGRPDTTPPEVTVGKAVPEALEAFGLTTRGGLTFVFAGEKLVYVPSNGRIGELQHGG